MTIIVIREEDGTPELIQPKNGEFILAYTEQEVQPDGSEKVSVEGRYRHRFGELVVEAVEKRIFDDTMEKHKEVVGEFVKLLFQ